MPLWNSFFADLSAAIPDDFTEMKFADDLTSFKPYERNVDDASIMNEMKECQRRVHCWGVENRVVFDEKRKIRYP